MEEQVKDHEWIKRRLAPCGLHCGKCFAFTDGDISFHSRRLRESLGNFDGYAERFVKVLDAPVFGKYGDFKELLEYLGQGSCKGCREERCKLYRSCRVRLCSEKRGVDFCFECGEFPCEETGLDADLYRRHVAINERMREIGVHEYYEEVKDRTRY